MVYIARVKAETQESFVIRWPLNAAAPKACHHVLIHQVETSVTQRLTSASVQQLFQLATEMNTALWDLVLVIIRHPKGAYYFIKR